MFEFNNGDLLYALSHQQLSRINVQDLLNEQRIVYLEPNNELGTDIKLKHARSQLDNTQEQNFIKNDGFSALTVSQRNCEGVTIAVIDSGIDMEHGQLQHITFVQPIDTRQTDTPLIDEYGHGTHVAGLIAAKSTETSNVEGACSSATLLPIRFLDHYGAGSVMHAIQGVNWAIDHDAHVINHSWTVKNYSQALFDVIQEADLLDIIQVAAAGNHSSDNDQTPVYPAAFSTSLSGFIAVANWDNEQQQLYSTSNYGKTGVDIAASGTNLLSLTPDNMTKVRTGSSMAAPLVSATAAMMKQQDPSLTSSQVRSLLQLSSHKEASLINIVRSAGRLDASAALSENKGQANLLTAQSDAHQFVLNGVGFELGDQWQFVSADLVKTTYPLSAETRSNEQVTFAQQELSYGYWQLLREGMLITELLFQPDLTVPTVLEATNTGDGQLLTWRGSSAAQSYHLQAAIDEQGFKTIAVLDSPINQYEHLITDYQSIRYRIKASYDYQLNGGELHTKYSLYSEVLPIAVENIVWQTNIIASVPQGSTAIIPLKISIKNKEVGDFEVISDPLAFVSKLDESGRLYLNTEQVSNAVVTIAYNQNNTRSLKHLDISIHENDDIWSIAINQEEKLMLSASGFVINSFQQLVNGSYQVDGDIIDSQALLSLNLESSGREFNLVNVFEENQMIASNNIILGEQFVNLNLAVTPPETPITTPSSILPPSSVPSPSISLPIDVDLRQKNDSTDSRCFIASSIYAKQPEKIKKLREFRDNTLLAMPGGSKIVATYYHYSPKLVEKIKGKPKLQKKIAGFLDLFL